MIVDDSRTGRMVLKKVLPAALLTDLVEAEGGVEAIRVCQSESIELMFLDLTMPDLDGYHVLEHLQGTGRLPPTVVVSADVQPLAAGRVKALGALAFMKKWPTRVELEALLVGVGIL
jgi:CheY-like chemotaxis protein